MLAERRRRANYVLNPRNNTWAADDKNLGKKLMEKMGWSSGKGLGRDEQGDTEHIRVNYKNDNKGMGFSGPIDDPVLHQTDFNELLSKLNKAQGSEAPKPEGLSSLEKKSESSKSRLHYKKFTRGKDLSRYSAKDLECIIGNGKKKKVEEVEVKVEESKVGEQEHSHGVDTVAGGSMADYFKRKMMERGLLKPKEESKDEESGGKDFGFVGFGFSGPIKMEEVKEEPKKSKKRKNKFGDAECIPSFEELKNCELETDEKPKKRKKKNKKHKEENEEVPEEVPDNVQIQEDEIVLEESVIKNQGEEIEEVSEKAKKKKKKSKKNKS